MKAFYFFYYISMFKYYSLFLMIVLIIVVSGCSKTKIEQKSSFNWSWIQDQKVTGDNLSGEKKVVAPKADVLPTQAKLFYILLEDAGNSGKLIGCNDSLVSVQVSFAPWLQTWNDLLEDLYTRQFAAESQPNGSETMFETGITVNSITVSGALVSVYLGGAIVLNGVCDHPRITEQLQSIVLQFPQFTTVKLYINNQTLSSYLSLQ